MKEWIEDIMEEFKDYRIGKEFELGAKFVSFILEKIYDFSKENLSKIKYKRIFDYSKEFAGEFLHCVDFSVSKKGYKIDSMFQKFDKDYVKIRINEIFENENVEENIIKKINQDINDFNSNNKSHNLNILLFSQEKKFMEKFFKILSNQFKIEKINDNEFSINIEFEDNFKEIKAITLIKYHEGFEFNKGINCVWYFMKNENIKDENKLIEQIKEKNIPMIYIHKLQQIYEDQLISFEEDINIENDEIINGFNHEVIDINEINNKDDNHFMNLISKSIFIILIKNYEIYITKKCQKVLEKILKLLKFVSGNKINKIVVLNYNFMKKIFSAMIFENKPITNFVKSKINLILYNYKDYLLEYEKSLLSDFVRKIGDDYIAKIKAKINNKNIKLNQKKNLTNEEKENMEIYNELEHYKIEFIQQIDVNEKDNPKDNKKNENGFNDNLKIKFNDYFLEKASIYIIELVILLIKENFIKYYKLSALKSYINMSNQEKVFVNDIKED